MRLAATVFISLLALPASWAENANRIYTAPAAQSAGPQATRWAKPLDGGPLRMLMIAPRDGMGDADALAERLDAEIVRCSVWASDALGAPESDASSLARNHASDAVAQRLRDILRQEKRLDLIVLANVAPAILPEDALSEIVARTARGGGLVLAHLQHYDLGPLQPIVEALEQIENSTEILAGAGEFEYTRHVHLAALNEGRVATFAFPGDPPRYHALLPAPPGPVLYHPRFEEDALGLAIRALVWAAGRRPEVTIVGITDESPAGPNPEEIPADFPQEYVASMQDLVVDQPIRPFRVLLSGPMPESLNARIQLRSPEALNPVYTVQERVPKGAASVDTFLLVGPGTHRVEVWLEGRKGVRDWFSQEIQINDWPEISGLTANKTYLLANDRLDLVVYVRAVHSQRRAATLYARATDNYGRLLADDLRMVSAEGGGVNLSLEFFDLIAPIVRVEVFAVPGEMRIPNEWALGMSPPRVLHFAVRQPDLAPRMRLMVSETDLSEPAAVRRLRRLADRGVDAVYAAASENSMVQAAAAGLRFLPEVWSARAALALYTAPCLDDAALIAGESNRIEAVTVQQWAGGMARYGLGPADALIAHADCGDAAAPTDVAAEFVGSLAGRVRGVDREARPGMYFEETPAPELADALRAGLDWLAIPADRAALSGLAAEQGGCHPVLRLQAQALESVASASWWPWCLALHGGDLIWLLGDVPSALEEPPAKGRHAQNSLASLFASVAHINETAAPLLQAARRVAWNLAPDDTDFVGERARFSLGQADIAMVLAAPETASQRGAFQFAQDGHIYDILRGVLLAKGKREFSYKLQPGEAMLAACLPYRVEALRIDTPDHVLAGKRLSLRCSVIGRDALPGEHLLAVSLVMPNGETPDYYRSVVNCPGGRGETYFPLALNATPGRYQIHARDLLSGIQTVGSVEVNPPLPRN